MLNLLNPSPLEAIASVLFALAILHTFAIKFFQHLALKFPEGSVCENLFHLLGEVEIVFGLWAALFLGAMAMIIGKEKTIYFIDNANFTEPLFVFVIMTVTATKPILQFSRRIIKSFSKLLPLPSQVSFFLSILVIGPLLGSFITEPAAMTVTALILRDAYFSQNLSQRFKYMTLGTLFVNISIGGVLTHFAAPPVLMVATTWHWTLSYMFTHFGWKAVIATLCNSILLSYFLRKELILLDEPSSPTTQMSPPGWLSLLHFLFLALIVLVAHHPAVFLGFFLFFIGLTTITREYQDELKLKESLLVAFFLGGLVLLGSQQSWWLDPMIRKLTASPLFFSATILTAFTDNAAITFLGAQIEGISENLKYALVAGAVSGGGLTIIANAPNPAGFAILKDSFGPEGISPLQLAFRALPATLVAMACFWLLPSF